MLTPHKITPTLYEIRVKDGNKIRHQIGSAEMQEDGYFLFEGFDSHTLREIADILDALNAPIEASLKEYFDKLPPEIRRDIEGNDELF